MGVGTQWSKVFKDGGWRLCSYKTFFLANGRCHIKLSIAGNFNYQLPKGSTKRDLYTLIHNHLVDNGFEICLRDSQWDMISAEDQELWSTSRDYNWSANLTIYCYPPTLLRRK